MKLLAVILAVGLVGEVFATEDATPDRKSHPTVKCEHIIPEKDKASSRNHKACTSHCQSLRSEYSEGECMGGICHCLHDTSNEIIDKDDRYPTVKCIDLIPDEGEASDTNDLACDAHCQTIRYEYKKGECIDGICHCNLKL